MDVKYGEKLLLRSPSGLVGAVKSADRWQPTVKPAEEAAFSDTVEFLGAQAGPSPRAEEEEDHVVRYGDTVTLRCITGSKSGARFFNPRYTPLRYFDDGSVVRGDRKNTHSFTILCPNARRDGVEYRRAGDALQGGSVFALEALFRDMGKFVVEEGDGSFRLEDAFSDLAVFTVEKLPPSRLSQLVADAPPGRAVPPAVLELYENQRYYSKEWNTPGRALYKLDRQNFTDESGKSSYDWVNMLDGCGTWSLELADDLDAEGWEYGWDFSALGGDKRKKSADMMSRTRRRKWTRPPPVVRATEEKARSLSSLRAKNRRAISMREATASARAATVSVAAVDLEPAIMEEMWTVEVLMLRDGVATEASLGVNVTLAHLALSAGSDTWAFDMQDVVAVRVQEDDGGPQLPRWVVVQVAPAGEAETRQIVVRPVDEDGGGAAADSSSHYVAAGVLEGEHEPAAALMQRIMDALPQPLPALRSHLIKEALRLRARVDRMLTEAKTAEHDILKAEASSAEELEEEKEIEAMKEEQLAILAAVERTVDALASSNWSRAFLTDVEQVTTGLLTDMDKDVAMVEEGRHILEEQSKVLREAFEQIKEACDMQAKLTAQFAQPLIPKAVRLEDMEFDGEMSGMGAMMQSAMKSLMTGGAPDMQELKDVASKAKEDAEAKGAEAKAKKEAEEAARAEAEAEAKAAAEAEAAARAAAAADSDSKGEEGEEGDLEAGTMIPVLTEAPYKRVRKLEPEEYQNHRPWLKCFIVLCFVDVVLMIVLSSIPG